MDKIVITLPTGSQVTYDHRTYYLYISTNGVLVVKNRRTDNIREAYPEGAWVRAENTFC